ncbi:GNAT family N-acetyltransferase [Paenibacillus tengchongensis]|uniref:GNAT family N-acetyltransferase n=1 Tax=Paenibacillus tengchongensis TaxID=2608684 RepID=UPI00124DB5F6|nr:GNAT family N-acetyltransferase [Paenibacillus tengchongensis]
MNDIERAGILRLISSISTGAESYVRDGFAQGNVTVVCYADSVEAEGVFCLVENPDSVIAYAVFVRQDKPEALLELMEHTIRPYLGTEETREVCFNVHGRNTEIIEWVRKLGFVPDMEGFHLHYTSSEPDFPIENSALTERGFSPAMLESFISVFDGAYLRLNLDNGWETGACRNHPEAFLENLTRHEARRQVHSYWLDERLAGAVITEGNYIRDLVVAPEFQNHGYGAGILRSSVSRMLEQRPGEPVYVRVAGSNAGAKRFYERHGFAEIACFAEHTFCR